MLAFSTVAIAFTAVATAFTATTATAVASAFAAQYFGIFGHFSSRSLVTIFYFSHEVKMFAGERMVEIHLHFVVGDVKHPAVESVPLLVLQRHDGILVDVFCVKLTVDGEDPLVQIEHMLVVVFAVGLLGREGEVEFVALVQFDEGVLEGLKRDAHSADKVEGPVFGCLFHQFFLSVSHIIQHIRSCDIFIGVLFHFFVCL